MISTFIHQKFLLWSKIIQPSVYHEHRGEISTTYHSDYYDRLIPIKEKRGSKFKHDRYSKSEEGVLRGLHWDDKTWKMVSCLHGKIYLVVLDVRVVIQPKIHNMVVGNLHFITIHSNTSLNTTSWQWTLCNGKNSIFLTNCHTMVSL